MSRKTRVWVLLFGMVCLAGLVVAFAPSIIAPFIDDYISKSDLDQSLAACKPDEIVYVAFYNPHGKESATFNFTTKQLSGGDGEGGSGTSSLFGGSKSVFFTTQLGSATPYDDEQVGEIKTILATLPEPASSVLGSGSYRDQLHLAFYRNDQLVIYHYPKSRAPSQLADLCKALKISEHAE